MSTNNLQDFNMFQEEILNVEQMLQLKGGNNDKRGARPGTKSAGKANNGKANGKIDKYNRD